MMNLTIKLVLIVLFLSAGLLSAQAQTAKPLAPDALVANLYKAHNAKRSPFFQTRSRARIYQYFEKDLADLILKDAVTSKGEVGVIDGDPLYDAQDMEIKKFAISKARREDERSLVDVTFENFGEKKTITFILVKRKAGWRIFDIVYSEGRTLRSEFKEGR